MLYFVNQLEVGINSIGVDQGLILVEYRRSKEFCPMKICKWIQTSKQLKFYNRLPQSAQAEGFPMVLTAF